MDKDEQMATKLQQLRHRAEQQVTPVNKQDIAGMSADDIAVLIHELETHQIELEMQNDELLRAQTCTARGA